MKYFLPILLGFSLVGANAQTSYDVTNRVVLENEDCQLTKTSLILPVPQSNNYQTITNLEYSSGQVLDAVNSENKYLRDVKVSDLPGIGESYSLTEHFDVTLYPMHIDMSQFETLYPYDTESDIYKRYTVSKGEYIDIENQTIQQVSDRIWSQSNENVLTYAELCYEYVAENYEYLNPNTGIHPIAEILSDGGGDCGNLASIYAAQGKLDRAQQLVERALALRLLGRPFLFKPRKTAARQCVPLRHFALRAPPAC